ncbi:sterol O-acyltransferase 2-like [Schistocerca serialis cubense]|uniref:sterol O-acyltransferase 2-like n=1 Tax=Schistocerca serialis cubense TaxID=2023355 RepID=UPI00214ECD8F|nr:sterol O-acyltransferase 2-like [Schistocerca serialis cubense]
MPAKEIVQGDKMGGPREGSLEAQSVVHPQEAAVDSPSGTREQSQIDTVDSAGTEKSSQVSNGTDIVKSEIDGIPVRYSEAISLDGLELSANNRCRGKKTVGLQSEIEPRGNLGKERRRLFSAQNPDLVQECFVKSSLRLFLGAQQLHEETLEQLELKLQQLLETALVAADGPPPATRHHHPHLLYDSAKYRNRDKPARDGSLPQKQFLARESVLTEMLKVRHFRTVYNIFIATLLMLFLQTAVYDFVIEGRVKLGLSLVWWNFSGYHTCLFFLNAATQQSDAGSGYGRRVLDLGGLVSLLWFQTQFFVLPARIVYANRLPPVSAMIILAEQVRMLMKTHAFIRSNVPHVLAYKPHTERSSRLVPEFSKFLYFMFVPTLLYRDSYPRTKEIRWKVVAWHLAEVCAVILFISITFERSLLPLFVDFGKHPPCPRSLIAAVFGSMVPSLAVFLSCFYCVLHAWQNAFAEIMGFADRMFYKDWWNARSHAAYYRTWNVIVHDWLYEHVYRDVSRLLGPGRRTQPLLAVFLLSAAVHEYIVTYTFGFFYPTLFVAFGICSVGLVFVTHDQLRGGNVMLWLQLMVGTGLLVSAHLMEWEARQRCPPAVDSSWDFYIPRSWFCFSSLEGI